LAALPNRKESIIMPDLKDGDSTTMQGSGRQPYVLKNVGGVYSCSCPAWRNQSLPIEQRTCKHLRKLRGEDAEQKRVGQFATSPASHKQKSSSPALLLAETWDNHRDVSDWWMSEKLDGVRAYWNGRQFLSRQGNQFHAPAWFVAGLPNVPLDGELWLARKSFQKTISIVRRQDQPAAWSEIKFLIFDAPQVAAPFETRLASVTATFQEHSPVYANVLAQQRCKSPSHLHQELTRIESLGGEGLMLRQPESAYEAGRSSTLLKVKTFHDAEAVVIDHLIGRGRHKGRLGALLVRLPDGTEFSVGTGLTDAQRNDPPPIGTTITFRYQELTDGGVPRFPSFVGVC
jgi:DNA ligase-1